MISYFMQNSRANYIKTFAYLFFSILIYVSGYMMILNTKTIQNIIFLNYLQYIGVPFISYLWLIIVLLYGGILKRFKSTTTFLLAIIPILTFISRFTNSYHNMYYKSFNVIEKNNINLLLIDKGFIYYVFQTYHLIVTLSIIIIYFTVYLKSEGREKKKYNIFVKASIIPAFAVVLNLVDPFSIGIDYIAILLPIVIIILSYAVFQYDFLEIKNIARNEVFYSSDFPILILNRYMEIMDFNPCAENFFNLIRLKIPNISLRKIASDDDLYNLLIKKDTQFFQYEIDQEMKIWKIETHLIKNKFYSKLEYGYIKYIREVTNEVKTKNILEYLAKTDELSKLNNRREFISSAQKILEISNKNNTTVSVITIDIDDFKSINDSFGHHIGDEVIKFIGTKIRESIRRTDIAGRLGGEEFTILLPNLNGIKAFKRAEILREKIFKSRFIKENPEKVITISIGIAESYKNETLESLLIRADKAMYESKNTGKNKTTLFSELRKKFL